MQRQDRVSPTASHPPTASSSYFRVPCSVWRPGLGLAPRSPRCGLFDPLCSLSVGLELELWQLMAQGMGRGGSCPRDIFQSCHPHGFFWSPLFHSLPFCFWGNTVSVAHLPLPLLVNFGTAGTANILASASILGNDEDTLSNKAHSPVMPKVGVFEGGVGRGIHSCFSLCAFCAFFSPSGCS